jgi:virginiamycin B lyase
MRDRIAALAQRAPRLARLSTALLAAAGGLATPAGAVSIAVHPIATPGYEEPEAIQGAPGGLILKSAVGRRSALQRVTPAPFALGAPMPIEASAIGAGPDGNVWAAVGTSGTWTLGAVTPAGYVPSRVLAPPSSSMLPNLLAAGPDGSVWVGDLLGADVVRVLPDGRTTSYEGAQGPGDPTGIAFSGDGAAWVTESGAHEHIWEIAPTGQVLDREIPAGLAQFGNCHCDAHAIAAGPDGALWFVERMFGRIVRMTEGGEWTSFELPDPANVPVGELGAPRPEALTVGPDGALWFLDAGQGEIGRIALAGGVQISEFPVPVAHTGAEVSLRALTPYAGELWAPAVETLVSNGAVTSRRSLLLEVDPSGNPQPSAAGDPPPHAARHRVRCRRAARRGGPLHTASRRARCPRSLRRHRAG